MKNIVKKISFFLFLVLLTACSESEMMALEDAQTKALEQINGDVLSFQENLDDQTPHYLFTITQDGKNYDVKVDASDGSIISKDLSDIQEEEFDEDSARDLALEQFDQATISDITYQEEEGTYSAIVSDGVNYYEVTIDKESKEVTEIKQKSTE